MELMGWLQSGRTSATSADYASCRDRYDGATRTVAAAAAAAAQQQ